ncbi:MAG: hypothetical protein NVSMB52_06780 [Chloroflexota bacterium]
MSTANTTRDTNLRFLEEYAPQVFTAVNLRVRQLGNQDIEQLVRYARWLQKHQHDWKSCTTQHSSERTA